MKKVININLAGRLIPIEDTAYDSLKNYLNGLSQYFSREEGGHEIVSDIEDRIAELFQKRLHQDLEFIADAEVKEVIAIMGQPEQLEDEISTEPLEKSFPGTQKEEVKSEGKASVKKLRRNKKDKILGGVCSGIAHYFNIDPVIVRITAFILFMIYGVGLLAYLVLWIVLPGESFEDQKLRRRLYRDPDKKVIGGVASGLASYYKIDVIIPRIIFLLPLIGLILSRFTHPRYYFPQGYWWSYAPFSFGILNSLLLLYVILWIVVPKAVTRTEKMEMKGEKVDVESLSNAHKSSNGEKKKRHPG